MTKLFILSTLPEFEYQSFAKQLKAETNRTGAVDIVLIDGASEKSKSFSTINSSSDRAFVLVVDSKVRINFEAICGLLNKDSDQDFFDIAFFDSLVESGFGSKTKIQRPDFARERLLNQYYLGPAILISHETFMSFSTISTLEESNYSRALVLEGIETAKKFKHFKTEAYVQQSEAIHFGYPVALSPLLQKALVATGGGELSLSEGGDTVFPNRTVEENPLVSIVIPSRGKYIEKSGDEISLLINCLKSIFERTDYKNLEILVVLDSDADQRVLDWLRSSNTPQHPVSIISWDKPFNFSEKMNLGVSHAAGDYVLLLNDDIEVLSPNWVNSMLGLAQLPGAGMVGAMLYYEDSTIQHAGHSYYKGSPTHIGLGLERGSFGPMGSLKLVREVAGVTAACSMMPKKVFMEIGGFSSLLPGNFNDVDLCLKTRWKNFEIYWTPDAELYHYESKTRDAHVHYYELDVIQKRWGLQLDDSSFWPWRPNAE